MARKSQSVYKRSTSNAPGRRYYDGSTKGVIATGLGGGAVVGALTSIFMFMNAAPWASKSEVETIKIELSKVESLIKQHVDGPGHSANVREMATVQAQITTMQDTLKEIKDDVKDIKDRGNGRRQLEKKMPELTLGQKQRLFTKLLGKLIDYAYSKGYELSIAEGYIGDSINKPSEDTPHLRHGAHFNRLGIDLNLFIAGTFISNGSHPAWLDLATFWVNLNPLCRCGYFFSSRDSNHFSLIHNGIAQEIK